jgi:glutathione S-transferase
MSLKLVGVYSSAFVRRVAISMRVLGVPYEHVPLSAFRHVEELRAINPLLKAPTLVFEDGSTLQNGDYILDWLDQQTDQPLLPRDPNKRLENQRIMAVALLAAEKGLSLVFERMMRPKEMQSTKVVSRLEGQISAALLLLEHDPRFAEIGDQPPLELDQAQITASVVVGFLASTYGHLIPAAQYPKLMALSAQMEQHPAFIATRPAAP